VLVRGLLGMWLLAVVLAFLAINIGMDDPANEPFRGLWPLTHPYWFNPLIALVALVPALVFGSSVARAFGLRTKAGSAALAFAAGIVAWCLGNLVWFWYNTCTSWGALGCDAAISAPYPSAADVGFIALLPCYAFAMVQLARMLATGWRDVLRLAWVPLVVAAVTVYVMFPSFSIAGVEVPNRSLLFDDGYTHAQVVFSVLYAITDAILLSMAIVIALRARHAAGGIFLRPMLCAAAALTLQYVADLVFNIRVANDTSFAGDIADFLYFWAMFVMVLGIYLLGRAHRRLQLQVTQMAAAMEFELDALHELGEPVATPPGEVAP